MANEQLSSRTSYFRVIPGLEEEFLRYAGKLLSEGDLRIIIDANVTVSETEWPTEKFPRDARGFAILDCGDMEVCIEPEDEDSEEDDVYEDGFHTLVTRFLKPGHAVFRTTAFHCKMRYMGGSASLGIKNAEGEVDFACVNSLNWCDEHLRQLAQRGIEVTSPEY